ncbi:DUF3035 domain-containing protein [Thalassococcus sp. BH17M4-6]|uniref:DUF3035 domain-containing protein n=1 Tax=Thalassococcus sp. BH17M4-6 TaxID=3413148 RepID=UPI003BEB52DA
MFLPRLVILVGLTALAACGDREPRLRDMSTNRSTPEEFSIVPNKPLQLPETLAQLPAPTPGGANRTDQTPQADAVASLGGNPARLNRSGGIPANDGALVRAAGRFGTQSDIRRTLAEEDLAFRKRKSLFSWQLFKEDQYNRAYRAQRLDAEEELLRWRRGGRRTPSAPPDAK